MSFPSDQLVVKKRRVDDASFSAIAPVVRGANGDTAFYLEMAIEKIQTLSHEYKKHQPERLFRWAIKALPKRDQDERISFSVLRVLGVAKWLGSYERLSIANSKTTPLHVSICKDHDKVEDELIEWLKVHPLSVDPHRRLSGESELFANSLILNSFESTLKDLSFKKQSAVEIRDANSSLQGFMLLKKEDKVVEVELLLKGFWNCRDFDEYSEKLRASGIGSALMEHAIHFANFNKLSKIVLESTYPAMNFYKKIGFIHNDAYLDPSSLLMLKEQMLEFISSKYAGRASFSDFIDFSD